jgi:serine protease
LKLQPTIFQLACPVVVVLAAVAIVALADTAAAHPRSRATSAPYVHGEVVVGYAPTASGAVAGAASMINGLRSTGPTDPGQQVLRLPAGETVRAAVARLRHTPGVAYAVPNYLAHTASAVFVPNDPGRSGRPKGWQSMQWNFLAGSGVDAPGAWANLRADGHPGGQGAVVAIVDTGVAYRNWHQFRRSPDFTRAHFTDPYDFLAHNRFPLDRNGHGTFIAGTVAESTNNGRGLTGLAYGATLMPVRVLNSNGWGNAATIARGIRYAVNHGAQVINLSLEFDPSVTAPEIPDIISALEYAHRRGVVVVGSAGNEADTHMAYPARSTDVISVGATTKDRCLAEYSNTDRRLDLVAPGGGPDAAGLNDPNCHPDRNQPDIFQLTFPDPGRPQKFGFPNDWFGTSMSAAHVSAAAALVIASGVLGRHPSPNQVLDRLESTAQPLGSPAPNADYGHGLLDAAAATARASAH